MFAFKNRQTRKAAFLHEVALPHDDIAPHEMMVVNACIIGATKDAEYVEIEWKDTGDVSNLMLIHVEGSSNGLPKL